jgi:hypothetical protein
LTKQFETLEWLEGGQDLIALIREYPVKVEILTSSGGLNLYDEVREQKEVWLKKQGISYRPNVVPGRKYKCMFASPEHILIDDMVDIIERFRECDGIGIHHTDVNVTLEMLRHLLAE